MDNDPKHSSKYIKWLIKFHGIYWWKTLAESTGLNPLKIVGGSLKQFLQSFYKPSNLQELIDSIEEFWQSLTSEKYIQKVMRKVDSNYPSGY